MQDKDNGHCDVMGIIVQEITSKQACSNVFIQEI